MAKDSIQLTKVKDKDQYELSIYFEEFNKTVNVVFTEANLIKLLRAAVDLLNQETSKATLSIPEKLTHNLTSTNAAELSAMQGAANKRKSRPPAEAVIYISDHHVSLYRSEAITNAVGDFMEAMGFELETEDEPIFMSFFKRLKFLFSRTIGSEDLEEIYHKGKKALELKHIELPTAEQTEKLASAAQHLVNSLGEAKEGLVRCGALIVLKKQVNGETRIIIQQLTTDLIMLLDKKPKMIKNLHAMYELLNPDSDDQEDEAEETGIRIA